MRTLRHFVSLASGLGLFATALVPAAAVAADITGRIVYEGAVPTLRPVAMDADPACAAKHSSPVKPDLLVLGAGNALANVFVQVKSGAPAKQHAAPTTPVVIDQKGCMYHPHVVGVMAGQPLQFRNSDGILHNVHGLPKQNREFNLGMPATVTEQSVNLNRPEPLFPVKCDVHPWMNAYVAVMSHPFWAVTDEDGSYTIEDLPAGTYTVEAWHERLGTQTHEVTVTDGETGSADFQFAAPTAG
jgi:plastocyanin